ncbi:uncharacterized protein LOC131928658 [Physella acuta]|uniref:uncharacterized protein LOC131928658 n=1 Tax=Physella acuta TaxID=109671 RepID=UPI0027DD3A49|nr:uncharacterized protein LOC131928658 [Physella acuta]
MAAMKVLCLTAFVLTATIGLISGDCSSGFQQCQESLMQSMLSVTNKDEICSGIETFIACVFEQGCRITPDHEADLIYKLNNVFVKHNLRCSFTASDLINKYKNGATSRKNGSTCSSVLPSALMLTVLFFVSLKMRMF